MSCVAPTGGAAVARRSAGTTAALSTAAIVGISAGSFTGLALGGFGIYCLIKYFKRPSGSPSTGHHTGDTAKLKIQLEPEPELDQKPESPDQVLDHNLVTVVPQQPPTDFEAARQGADFEDDLPEARPEVHTVTAQSAVEINPPSNSEIPREGDL